MEHFYKSNTTVVTPKRAAKGLKVAMGSKIFSVLLLGFFLLVGGEVVAQDTFFSQGSGNWETVSNWGIAKNSSNPNPQQVDIATRLPGKGDNVSIQQAHTIIVSSNTAICNTLTLLPGSGSLSTRSSGKIAIGFDPSSTNKVFVSSSKLTVNILRVAIGNGTPKENGHIYIGGKGTLTVESQIERSGNSGQGVSSLIYYEFHKGSTVEYNGGAQNIYQFSLLNDTSTINSGAYYHLILSGSGIKDAYNVNNTSFYGLDIKGNLTIRDNANLQLGSFSHSVLGNLVLSNSTASITGNSGTSELGLTVGGNVTNNGNITFQSRVLTVGGNFTNNTGATFTAGLGSHSIAGNFTNNTGATFTAGTGTHTISGNWNNAGTFNAGATGTIALNGLNKTISSTGTIGAFNNLNLSRGAKELLSDITVNKELFLSNTILDTKAHKVVLGSSFGTIALGENENQHIRGTVETTRNITSGATNVFGEIGFRIAGSAANLGNVTVRRVTGTPYQSPNGNYSEPRQFYVSSGSAVDGLNTAIEMKFPAYDLNTPPASAYDIYRFSGAGLNTVDKLVNTSSSILEYTYKVDNAAKYGMYTLSSTIVPLPVELVSFKAQRHAQGVYLAWATASELDNSGFEVQVSTDARTFEKIGFVESKVGTTSLRQEYSFLDTKAVSDTRYYRLKQIDLDGTITYSSIRAVALGEGNGQVSTYPNPFDNMVVVKLNGTEVRNVKAVLLNAQGKAILEQQQETAGNTITLDMSGVTTKGMYMLHVLDNGKRHTFKLMKR